MKIESLHLLVHYFACGFASIDVWPRDWTSSLFNLFEWQLTILWECVCEYVYFPFFVYTLFNRSFHCANEDNMTAQFHDMLCFHLHPFGDGKKSTLTYHYTLFRVRALKGTLSYLFIHTHTHMQTITFFIYPELHISSLNRA